MPSPETWLSSPRLRRHAWRYAGLAVLLTALVWAVVAISGVPPYGRRGGITWPLLMWCIGVGLWTYRRRRDTAMGFGRAFGLAALITVLTTVGTAVVLALFVALGPARLLAQHRAEVRADLIADRAKLTALPGGAALYEQNLASVDRISATTLAVQDGLLRLGVGLLTGLLAAILLRKANPDGSEPPRAPRPPNV